MRSTLRLLGGKAAQRRRSLCEKADAFRSPRGDGGPPGKPTATHGPRQGKRYGQVVKDLPLTPYGFPDRVYVPSTI